MKRKAILYIALFLTLSLTACRSQESKQDSNTEESKPDTSNDVLNKARESFQDFNDSITPKKDSVKADSAGGKR